MIKVIAIDGPSGTGKSTVAKALAQRLGWTYLDTGAMYRAVTHAWLQNGEQDHNLQDDHWLNQQTLDFKGSSTYLNGEDVSAPIRGSLVTANVSKVSAAPAVRRYLTRQQRDIGMTKPCVLEGRDIGTVVFPGAFFKVFLTASTAVRAKRRWLQLGGHTSEHDLNTIEADLVRRDHLDSHRSTAPLKRSEDAYDLHTDHLSEEAVIENLYQEAQRRLSAS